MPAAAQAIRYPATNSESRGARSDLRSEVRSEVMVREYSDATGATAGSIIAVIITAHIGRNCPSGMPMLPGPFPKSRAYAITPTHASAARAISATGVGVRRNDGRAAPSAGAV